MRQKDSSQLHILEVYHSWDVDEPGGVISMMTDLVNGFRDRNDCQVTLLINNWASSTPEPVKDKHGQAYYHFRLPAPPDSWWLPFAWLKWLIRLPVAVRRLIQFCKSNNIDIIHLHYASSIYLIFVFARYLGGPPYVITTHRGDIMRYPDAGSATKRAIRKVLTAASRVTAVSYWLAEQADNLYTSTIATHTIYNGFSQPDISEVCVDMDLPDQYAVLIANCRHYKGHDIAIQAWPDILERHPDLHLLIIGGGPDLEKMKVMVQGMKLEHRVLFTNSVHRKQALSMLQTAQCMIAPSRNEGQGIVLLEAALAETPLICSDIPPFLEMVTADKTAYVFRSEDGGALKEQLFKLLGTDNTALIQAFKQHVQKEHSTQAMVENYFQLFRSIVHKKLGSAKN